jgi:hypothetical protein
LKLLFFFIS